MKVAKGSTRLPWNSRTPFQIMPQARKVNASGTAGGNLINVDGMLPSASDEAPISRAPPSKCADIALLQPVNNQEQAEQAGNAYRHQRQRW